MTASDIETSKWQHRVELVHSKYGLLPELLPGVIFIGLSLAGLLFLASTQAAAIFAR